MSAWFWRMFTRLPVRGLFYAALTLLALTVLWWLLPDAARRRPVPATAPAGTEAPRPPAASTRPRLPGARMEEQANPFTSDYLQEWTRAAALANQPPPPEEDPAPGAGERDPARTAPPDGEAPEATVLPIQLLYRGFLVGPDGTARALIEELGVAAAYYGKGATLHGMELVGMNRDAAEFRRGDTLFRLPAGRPQEVEVPSP